MNITIKTIIKSLLLLSATTLLVFQSTSFAGVYKWTDEDGQVHYGQHPESSNAETVIIRTNETTKTGIADRADKQNNEDGQDGTQTDSDASAPTGDPAEIQPEIFVEEKIPAKEKRMLCEQAKQDYTAISNRGRMREINEKGEYVFLTEDQRQQRLSAANKRKKKYCQ